MQISFPRIGLMPALTAMMLTLLIVPATAGCRDTTAEKAKSVDRSVFAGQPGKMPDQERQAMAAGMQAARDAQAKAQAASKH